MNAPHNSSAALSEMIGLIYEAAADLTLWPQLLTCMSAYLELSIPEAPKTSGTVSQSEHSLMRFLAPHFERAHVFHQQLSEVVEERNLLEKVMNRLPMGMAIIDAQCNALSLNRTILALLQGNELLTLQAGRLVSSPDEILELAVARILTGEVADDVVRLGNEEGCLSLWISRGCAPNPADAQQSRLMLFVASRTSHALSEEGLMNLYGLTPAEARVTQKLALGNTLDESAEILAISKNTAKTQLTRVFSKIGVKRQTEMMQAIYASPLWLQTEHKQSTDMPLSINGIQQERHATEDQRLQLADGRWLHYSDSGDPQGHPVIFMHGIAGSRYLRHPDDDILMRQSIRLIIPERPGSGDSDPLPNRRIIDWPQDITELADHLQLGQFSVLGYSAGTGYALAVAAAMPQRVLTLNLVAAVPPIIELEDLRAFNPVFCMTLFVARYTPSLLPALMRVMVKDIRRNVYQYLEKIFADAPEQDREILANPKLRANIAAGLRASVKCNEQEIAQEVLITAKDWELDLNQIHMPAHIWYGEKDPLVSLGAAQKLAGMLPNAQLNVVPAAGHYLLYSHWQELLSAINKSASPGKFITHKDVHEVEFPTLTKGD